MADETLPSYSALSLHQNASPFEDHVYTETDAGSGRTITLNVSARSWGKNAFIFEGDSVSGTVILDLREASSVKSVCVELFGYMIVVGQIKYNFLNLKEKFPLPSGEHHGHLHLPGHGHQVPKGRYSWPFKLDLPNSVKLKHGDLETYPLPPSFGISQGRVAITYNLVATITHGVVGEAQSTGTHLIYIPAIKPGPPSAARQVAYETQGSLSGPADDPEGWYTLPKTEVQGTASDGRGTSISYQLSLALPLSYTRGTTIPLWLVIEGNDAQAVETLSAPDAPLVRLRRIVGEKYGFNSLLIGQTVDLQTVKPVMSKDADTETNIQAAVWWPAPAEQQHLAHARVLQGELHLSHHLMPSAQLGYFKNSYVVQLLPPVLASFKPVAHADVPLQSVPVEIGTIFADGPHPVAYSPPKYDHVPGEDGHKFFSLDFALAAFKAP